MSTTGAFGEPTIWSRAEGAVTLTLAGRFCAAAPAAAGGAGCALLYKMAPAITMPATTTAMGVTSALKLIPGVGTLIAAVTMPAYSAGATYLIGKVFIQHFASGGTLLDFNPPDYREFIKAQKERFSSRATRSSSAQPGNAGT